MYCNKCGSHILKGAKFCHNCGEPNPEPIVQTLTQSESPQQQSSKTTQQNPPRPVPVAKKKKSPLGAIVVIFIIFVIIVVAVSSAGSSSLENDLKETLPIEIRKYILEDSYNIGDLDYDDKGEQILQVNSLVIERHSTEGKSDTADCIIEMEDTYVKKTAYVTLYSTEYDTGWVVESWEETREADVTLKQAPNTELLKEHYNFKNISVSEDNLDMEKGQYTYSFSVNDFHTYATFMGDVKFTAHKSISYNYTYELPIYGWVYDVEENININWNVEDTWTLTSTDGSANKKAIVTINSMGTPIYNDSTGNYVGDYYGSAYYYNSSWYGQEYETDYDYSDGSGIYRVYGNGNPSDAKLQIDGHGSYFANCEIILEFTPDTARAYLDGKECQLFTNN